MFDHLVLCSSEVLLSVEEQSKEKSLIIEMNRRISPHYPWLNFSVILKWQSSLRWAPEFSDTAWLCILSVCEVIPLEMKEAKELRIAAGQQDLPEGPHHSTSGASHGAIKHHSKYLTGGGKLQKYPIQLLNHPNGYCYYLEALHISERHRRVWANWQQVSMCSRNIYVHVGVHTL